MRQVKNTRDELIGIINKATVKTLRTKSTPFVAAVPNRFHGIKTSYHKTLDEAVKWINKE